MWMGARTAGQATATVSTGTLSVGQAGITSNIPSSSGIMIGSTVTITIGANIGASSSVAYDFTLRYPTDALEFVSVTPMDSWGNKDTVFVETTLGTGEVTFERANIDYTDAFSGSVSLVQVTFNIGRALTSADYQALTFSSFHVYNLEDESNLITSTVGGSGGVEVSQCTEQTCRSDFDLISESECTPSTQEQCQTNYDVLITQDECPSAGVAVDGTSCTAYYNDATHSNEKDSLCGAWLNELEATDLTDAQRTTLCGQAATQGFNADLNGDTFVNDGDIIIIQLAMLAKESGYATCGDNGLNQPACQFAGPLYICEDLTNSNSESIICGGGN